MWTFLRLLRSRPLAALGGVALVTALTATPSVAAVADDGGDGPSNREPDDAAPVPASGVDGTYEPCSGLFGFGKAFTGYDVLVDGSEPVTPLVRGVDFELLLSGDLDGAGGVETCIPDDLTEAEWSASVYGTGGAAIPFPGPRHLVLPFPALKSTSVSPSAPAFEPFTLSIIEVVSPFEVVVGERSIANTASLPAVVATAEVVAAGVIGTTGVAAIDSAVADSQCADRIEARAAAVELFESMSEDFRDDWLSFGGGEPDNCNSFFQFVQNYYPERWVSYLRGTSAPAVFELSVPRAPIDPVGPTFTG